MLSIFAFKASLSDSATDSCSRAFLKITSIRQPSRIRAQCCARQGLSNAKSADATHLMHGNVCYECPTYRSSSESDILCATDPAVRNGLLRRTPCCLSAQVFRGSQSRPPRDVWPVCACCCDVSLRQMRILKVNFSGARGSHTHIAAHRADRRCVDVAGLACGGYVRHHTAPHTDICTSSCCALMNDSTCSPSPSTHDARCARCLPL